jgi:tyrocidine synthetase-3
MVPQVFEHLTELPLTANGKVNRAALPQPHLKSSTEFVAPRNEMEEELANLFSEVLGVQKIGIKDNFFELGGHSLKVVLLASRINKNFNVDLGPVALFNYPTVETLSSEIEKINWVSKSVTKMNDQEGDTETFSI